MAISAKDVQTLRQKTGVGIMECKKALVECNGDFEKAIKYLREKGISVAAKKAGRISAEGIVDIMKSDDGLTTAMVEVNSETDFVAKNESFREFVRGILRTILANKPADLAALNALEFDGKGVTVESEVKNEIFTIGENITLRRFVLVEGFTATYIHGKGAIGVVVLVDTDKANYGDEAIAEAANNCCLQIAAMAPAYLDRASVPQSAIDQEKEILSVQMQNDPANAKKPAAILEKMITGKINKFYSANCLLEQDYVKDDSIKVGKYLENVARECGKSFALKSFVKFEKGEGIQKKEEDFAAEIEKLVKGS